MSEESRKYPAKIINVSPDDEDVVINMGRLDGIEKGQRFFIYGLGEELFDPDTNESLGTLEIVRGTGRVTHVQDKMATITSETTQKLKRTNPLFGALSHFEEVERVPFKHPAKGDLAKPI